MKNFNHISLFLLVFFFLSCSSSDNSSEENNESGEEQAELSIEERLQAIIDAKVSDGLKGVSVSIRVNGQEQWSLVGGFSSETGMVTSNMKFGIASITKTVVAATILKLEEEALLSLDDTIGDWLTLESENIDDNITIFQLLNHLTGLKGYFQHPDIWTRVESDLDTAIPSEELIAYVGEPIFNAGERYEYSNSNYLILGLIIKAVSGQTVGETMRTRFWGPLGLANTYFGTDENVVGPVANPWRDSDGNGQIEDISADFKDAYHSVFFTAANVFTTSADLSMWAYLLYEGNALTETSKNKMLDFLFIDTGTPIFDGYGLGVRRINLAGRETWGHTGGMRGYGSYMLYEPTSSVSIAMLNNQSRSENGPLLRFELVEELLTEVFTELN
ncbi:serine hydrolase [Flagellimonas sp. CMM7]|uniref:serine hydrolase domain-containing protein n=1 Tax=Flagellimonas sp. CMM7 TaxID=2654676 RepID=UPI0013D79B9C|nr:serine hydrolase domain-containing protein [Flagellimonas sp. CMM7]UII79596.1 beta-lactamase family protein [Flagellimonas sp. CMM7]